VKLNSEDFLTPQEASSPPLRRNKIPRSKPAENIQEETNCVKRQAACDPDRLDILSTLE